jgi:flagellar motility protein MotE (MotC chaperone)
MMSFFRPRLLPVVIVAAFLLLGLKIGDLWSGAGASAIATAWAQAGAEKPPEPAVAPVAEKAPAPGETADRGEKPAEKTVDKPADAAMAEPAKPMAVGDTAKPPPTAVSAAAAKPATGPAARDPLLMSPAEIDVLQHLSERRTELDKRAAGLRDQEVLMQAAEKRIEERIAKLQALEQSIDGSAQKQDEEDDARVKSLVHIYEAMKPAEAARIFEQLEMPVLLNVVEHMRETKAAPVLAAMDPTKAKAVTMALADRRAQASTNQKSAQAGTPAQTVAH